MGNQIEDARISEIADRIMIAGFCCMGDQMGTSACERLRLYKLSSDERPGWARAMLKLLQWNLGSKKAEGYKEIDIYASFHTRAWLRAIGDIPRTRKEAADLFSQAPRKERGGAAVYATI